MTELPIGWESAKLGDVLTLNYGRSLPKNSRDGGQYSVYGSNGVVGANSTPLTKKPSIIIGRKGSIGKVTFSEEPSWAIDTSYYIDQFHNQPPKYWYYLLKHLPLTEMNRSTAIPGLNRGDAYSIQIKVPPLREQKMIADRIDFLMSRSENIRKILDTIPPLLIRYRESILAAAFQGHLTKNWREQFPDSEPIDRTISRIEKPSQPAGGRKATNRIIPGRYALSVNNGFKNIPDGWRCVKLTDIARQETGHTPSRKHARYWTGSHSWVGIKDAKDHHGRVIYETEQSITNDGLKNSAARLLPEGTVCLSRTASVGYVFVMGKEMATSQDFVTWTCSEALQPKFLMYLLMAEGEHIRTFGKGTTHTTIYFPEIRAFNVCIPSISEQNRIIELCDFAFRKIEILDSLIATAIQDQYDLDQSILVQAFRGELAPQDPNDEPASVLLKRIEVERAEMKNNQTLNKAIVKSPKRSKVRKMTIPVVEVLKRSDTPLTSQELLRQAGYPHDATTEQVEAFFLDVRYSIHGKKIIRKRIGDEDVFELAG